MHGELEQSLEKLQKKLRGSRDTSGVEVHTVRLLNVDVRKIRESLKLSRQEFAFAYGLSLRTVENWEDGRREPEGPAKSYLAAIAFASEAVAQALKDYRDGKFPVEAKGEGQPRRSVFRKPKFDPPPQRDQEDSAAQAGVDTPIDELLNKFNRNMEAISNLESVASRPEHFVPVRDRLNHLFGAAKVLVEHPDSVSGREELRKALEEVETPIGGAHSLVENK